MIPDFTEQGLLPAGMHVCTWDELEARFGWTARRVALLRGLEKAVTNLRAAGCARVYLDGSFVTAKDDPGDFDGCWDATGVDGAKLDPVLLRFDDGRRAQKLKCLGELFVASTVESASGQTFLDFFQHTKDGAPKGIVVLELGGST